MELKDAIAGWLASARATEEKTAQAVTDVPDVPDVPDDPDPAMPPGRLLTDGKATRQAILDTVQASVAKRFPVENDNYRIELHDVRYDGPTHYTLEQQKQALLHDRKLGCSLAGTWRLIDKKTGKVLEEKRDAVLRVPYYTNRGTIIHNGSEYTVISQARLSPGVYTRRKQNGDLESQFNVANGKGFRLELDKATGRIGMRMGQANLPLYPVLKAFGVDDKDIAKSWGSDVALANASKNDPKALQKLYERVSGYKYDPLMTPSNQAAYVRDELARFGLDPNTVVRTLGIENVTGVTPEVLLRAAQKLLNVNRGVEEPDNRDNPRFSKFYGVEHMLGERIDKDAAKLLKPMLFKVGRDKSLARVGRNALGPYIDDFLSTSGLAQPGEEANPMSILVQQSRITRTGEGGISSPDLITPEARGVQGDYLGFVDYIAGPESQAAGVDVRGAYGTVIGRDNKLYNIFRNLRTGKKEYLSLDQAADKVVAFPGQDLKAPYLYCMRNGVPDRVKTSEVDYMVPSFARTMGAGINMNPMPTAIFGMRSFYSSKFWEQYLPQKNGEVPLVDSLMPDGKMTFNEYYGRKAGCVTAPFSGTVTSVTKDGITVKGQDGKTETFDLVTNLPHNRMTYFTLFPLVKKGQEVREGDLLAHSNFTDPKTGAFNMGQNLKVAILPGARNANSFEDACWISASAAKKLSTSRLYNFDQDTKNGVKLGKNKYLAAFPSVFTKQQAETLDDSGVVKVGTELRRGDPIIVATGPKLLSAENAQLGKLSSVLKNAVTDKAQTWNHDWPGVVTDVVAGPNGAKVLIKSEPPVKVADKLSPRGALKGVTGTVLDDDKMPRDAVTNEPYDMLVNPMGFLSRVAPGQLMEIALGKVAKKTGRQMRLPQLPPPEGWLNWTKRQLAENGVSETADVFDPQTGRTIKGVGDGYMYVQAMHHLAEKKYSARGLEGGYTQDRQPAKGGETGAKKMCFTADQVVRVLHGEEKIGHICEKRIPAYVWTRFDDGSWGYSIVTNWFVRKGKMSEVLDVIVDGLPGFDRYGQKKVVYVDKALHVTKQHHVFSPDRGEILAGDLRPGDWLTSYGYVPTDDQMSLMMGSMLGDGCICNVNDNIRKQENGKLVGSLPFYQEQHSHHQYDYVNWKVRSLGALVSSRKNTQGKSKSGFRRKDGTDTRVAYYQVHRHDIAETLKNMFYRQPDGTLGRKNLSFVDLDRINDAGIAAFFLDDGHIAEHVKDGRKTGSPTGGISTLGFTKEENEKLATWLSGRLDADVHVGKCHMRVGDEVRYYSNLYLSADACRKMARLVARYVPLKAIPKTKKWLVEEVSRLQDLYVGIDTHYALGSVPVLVTSVKPYDDGRHGPDDDVCLYDMTVEKSHKYCASDCLVSNSGFDQNALLSHGATEVLKDAMTVRGTQNQEYWRALRLGLPIPEPGVPFIYEKFLNNLRAGGINVVEKGDVTSLLPQTDESIERLAEGRVIDSSQMVDADFDPVKGGLFDLGKTGGMGGLRWSMIQLPEPVPNPVMEEPVRRILGLTVRELSDVLAGRQELNGKTGGTAVKEALENLDIGRVMKQAQSDVRTKRGSARDNAVKVLGYLQAAERMRVSPKDWMITKVPVIPPAFRPISKAGNVALVPDTNELYKELLETKHNYEILKEDLPDSALTDERLNVYKAVKAAFGLGGSVTAEGQAKNLKGPIRQVIGQVPKCYDDETEILTENRRWIRIADLRVDDTVATVNPDTKALEWQVPNRVFHTPYCGKMVHTYSKKIDILVTPDHDHFVEIRRRDKTFMKARKIEAAELIYNKNRMRMLTAPSCGQKGTDPRTSFGGLSFADPEALARFLGMYLAEGWIPRKDETSSQVSICQSIQSDHVAYIDGFCKKLGVPVSRAEYVNEKGTRFSHFKPIRCVWWTITDRTFAQWVLHNFGAGLSEKFLSDEILAWDARFLRILIEAYLRGDGERNTYVPPKSRTCCATYKNRDPLVDYGSRSSTASKLLADDMANLCMRIGLGFRLTDVDEHEGHDAWNTTYRFRIDGWNKVIIGDSNVRTEWADYAGRVHCCTVENGLLVLRRNGRTFISGNCGQFQSKVVAKNQDLVGRSVTVPDKNLSMDQIGIPEDMAWTMYKPFVTRGLVQRGYAPVEAVKMIDERTPTARHILDDVMKEKPVLMDRAPTWHKFNIMAFKPFLVEGKEIRVCPMIDSGYNMDHDGDAQIGQIRVKLSKNDIYKIAEEKKKKNDDHYCTSLMNMLYFIHKQQ